MRRYAWALLGFAVSAVAVYYFFRQAPPDLLQRVAERGNVFIVGAAILVPAYLIRAFKAWLVLNVGVNAVPGAAASLWVSIALNNLLPLRLGDVLRIAYVGKTMKVGVIRTTAAVLVERIVDLFVILVLAALVSFIVLGDQFLPLLRDWISTLPLFTIVPAVVALVVIVAIAMLIFRRLRALIGSILGDLKPTAVRVALLLSASIVQWLLEICLLGYITSQLIGGIDGAQAILSSFLSNLSTLVPSAPGYVGTFEVAGILPFQILTGRVAAEQSLFVFLYHLVIWLFSTCLGLMALVGLTIGGQMFRRSSVSQVLSGDEGAGK